MVPMHPHTPPRDEAKTARKELKFQPSVLETIKNAARSVGMDPTAFITTAAFDRAKEIEQAQHLTLLPDAQFDAFAAAVDRNGKTNAALAASIAKGRAMLKDG